MKQEAPYNYVVVNICSSHFSTFILGAAARLGYMRTCRRLELF